VFVGHNDKELSYLLTYLLTYILTYLLRVGTGIAGHRVNNFGRVRSDNAYMYTMYNAGSLIRFRALIRAFVALLHGCSE